MNRRKKLLIGGGIVGALAAVLLLGGLATGVFAQSTLLSNPAISADEAKAAVLAAYPGTSAVEVELERENGQLIYEVGLDNGLEVVVDADTGAILGLDQDGPGDKDDDEGEAENEVEDADEPGDVDDVDDLEDDDANETDGDD